MVYSNYYWLLIKIKSAPILILLKVMLFSFHFFFVLIFILVKERKSCYLKRKQLFKITFFIFSNFSLVSIFLKIRVENEQHI